MQDSQNGALRKTDRSPIRRTDAQGRLKRDRTSQYIGVQIRTGRRLVGASRPMLANALGIEVPTLTSYEHGECEPPPAILARIATLLGKPPMWFSHQPESAAPSAAIAPAPATQLPTGKAGVGPANRPRVLLVDDTPDTLVILAAFLESSGLEVVTARTGDEALAVIAGDGPLHALVTDNVMPGLSGVDLVLQAAQLRPALPALIISGRALEGHGVDELPSSVGIVSKPIRRDELARRLVELTRAPDLVAADLVAMPIGQPVAGSRHD